MSGIDLSLLIQLIVPSKWDVSSLISENLSVLSAAMRGDVVGMVPRRICSLSSLLESALDSRRVPEVPDLLVRNVVEVHHRILEFPTEAFNMLSFLEALMRPGRESVT